MFDGQSFAINKDSELIGIGEAFKQEVLFVNEFLNLIIIALNTKSFSQMNYVI